MAGGEQLIQNGAEYSANIWGCYRRFDQTAYAISSSLSSRLDHGTSSYGNLPKSTKRLSAQQVRTGMRFLQHAEVGGIITTKTAKFTAAELEHLMNVAFAYDRPAQEESLLGRYRFDENGQLMLPVEYQASGELLHASNVPYIFAHNQALMTMNCLRSSGAGFLAEANFDHTFETAHMYDSPHQTWDRLGTRAEMIDMVAQLRYLLLNVYSVRDNSVAPSPRLLADASNFFTVSGFLYEKFFAPSEGRKYKGF